MSPAELKLAIDTVWVIVAACMVFLMQAGFAMLEVGLLARQERRRSRRQDPRQPLDRHARVLGGRLRARLRQRQQGARHRRVLPARLRRSASLSFSDVPLSAKFLFEVVFCTVSLAIVWGTMLDRTKFGVYIVFAIVFAALIYPLVGHWIWGGGFLASAACRTSPARRSSTSAARPRRSRARSCWERASASSTRRARPTRSRATRCRSPCSAC